MNKLKSFSRRVKQEIGVYQLILRDKRTPPAAKVLLGLAVSYLLLPFDLIPDFIPVLGQLDDLVIVPGLIWAALKFIPEEVLKECRQQMDATHSP